MKLHLRNLMFTVAAAVSASAFAGPVDVSYDQPASFSDAGDSPVLKEQNLKVLADHLQTLGQRYLPADQTLKVEVTDVALAGLAGAPNQQNVRIRVMHDGANAQIPSIDLRYTLSDHGKVLRSGSEHLSDLGYLDHMPQTRHDDPLGVEKRLLDDWFQSRFVKG